LRIAPAFVVVWLLTTLAAAAAQADPRPASSIPASFLVQPSDLAATLRSPSNSKPLVFQVGFRKLYDQAHIMGAEYVGAAGDDQGLGALRQRVAKLPKDAPIVIYCGCCPWSHCPNIAEAFNALRDLGFTRLKVLYIANNFGADWVDRGYPLGKAT
jgi:rhodanese-related sulfurtransferase